MALTPAELVFTAGVVFMFLIFLVMVWVTVQFRVFGALYLGR